MQSSPTGIATGGGNSTEKRDGSGMLFCFVFLKQLFEERKKLPQCGSCVLDNDDSGCRYSRIRESTSSLPCN